MKLRKRYLSASVVVTAAMIQACGGSPTRTNNPPEPVEHQNPPGPEASASAAPEPHRNPPAPEADKAPAASPK
jgi:hypothetical protein